MMALCLEGTRMFTARPAALSLLAEVRKLSMRAALLHPLCYLGLMALQLSTAPRLSQVALRSRHRFISMDDFVYLAEEGLRQTRGSAVVVSERSQMAEGTSMRPSWQAA